MARSIRPGFFDGTSIVNVRLFEDVELEKLKYKEMDGRSYTKETAEARGEKAGLKTQLSSIGKNVCNFISSWCFGQSLSRQKNVIITWIERKRTRVINGLLKLPSYHHRGPYPHSPVTTHTPWEPPHPRS
jgi:hypothetical protein